MLSTVSLFCLLTELLSAFCPSVKAFKIDLPLANWTIFFLSAFFFIAITQSKTLSAYSEHIILGTAVVFLAYLSYGVYLQSYDENLLRFYWVFLAVVASCLASHRHLQIFLLSGFLFVMSALLSLPSNSVPFPISFYALAIPMFLMALYLVFSSSIQSKKDIESSRHALQRKTQELDTILNTLHAMVAYKNADNVYLKVNSASAKFFGLPIAEMEGKSLYDLVPHDLAKSIHEEDKRIMAEGKPILNKLERIFSKADGKEIWLRTSKLPVFDEKGSPMGVVFSSEDVTDQVTAHRKLRESEERFRTIFDYSPNGMALIEFDSEAFMKTNKAMQDMLGYTEAELLGMPLDKVVLKEDLPEELRLREAILDKGLDHYSLDIRLLHKNGTLVVCQLSVFIVKENGKPVYRICSLLDISQLRENGLRLQRYAKQLEESNQNLQEFAYAASHDLREPLRTVVSYVQLLKKSLSKTDLSSDSVEFMDFVISGARRMEVQITALLEYSKVGRVVLEQKEVDLNEVVRNVCKSLTLQMAESQAVLTVNDLPSVVADAYQMEALLQNLVSNSIKYQKPGVPPQISVSAKADGGEYLFSVTDNGIGIEKGYLEKIFAVFRRLHTNDQVPGTGVGLSICRRIVQRHGGQIWAESEYGKGTTLYFSLPVLNGPKCELNPTHGPLPFSVR